MEESETAQPESGNPQPGEGRPAQFPPGTPPDFDPQTPEGITAVVVPAEVEEGEAEYVTAGLPPGTENLVGEKVMSLGSRTDAPARVLDLLEHGLSSSLDDEGVSLVSAGAARATGRAYRAEVSGALLSICPLAGGPCSTIHPVGGVFGSLFSAAHAEISVAYDEAGERFLLLAAGPTIEPTAEPTTEPTNDEAASGDHSQRIALAVSNAAGPHGEWHVVLLEEEGAAGRHTHSGRLEGLAIDADGLYVVAETADLNGNQGRRSVWRIDRGEETSGFYAGGTIQIVVYR